jgi:hypothetical protein
MNVNNDYIKMCLKAEKIQKSWNPTPGDWCTSIDGFILQFQKRESYLERNIVINRDGRNGEFDYYDDHAQKIMFNRSTHAYVWLPRQDQLQKMINLPIQNLIISFTSWVSHIITCKDYINFSLEQLWLSYVMEYNHNSFWLHDEWQRYDVKKTLSYWDPK